MRQHRQIKLRSPLVYPGGKARLLRIILPHFDKTASTLVEPFVGGGSVFLGADYPQAVINDIHPGVAGFWWEVLNDRLPLGLDPDHRFLAFAMQALGINETLTNEQERVALKMKDAQNHAHLLLALNRHSFGGNLRSSGLRDKARNKGKWMELFERLYTIRKTYKGRVEVFNRDYAEVPIPADSFLYCDPPYLGVGERLYQHGTFDARRFRDWIGSQKVPWLVSYNDVPEIRELYKGHEMIGWLEKSYMGDWRLRRKKPKRELLIFGNYHPHTLDALLF
jgi:DNA adenine methylase